MIRKSLCLLLMMVVANIAGCANIGAIKKDTSAKDAESMLMKSNNDLNSMLPIVKIPISKNQHFFEIGDANVYKMNSNIAVSFNRTPFKTAIKAIAKRINANIIFNYENKNSNSTALPYINPYMQNAFYPQGYGATGINTTGTNATGTTPATGAMGGVGTNMMMNYDYAYQITKDVQTSTKNVTYDTRNKIDYFDRMISLDYKGSLKELFNYLSETTGFFFIVQNNNLIIKSKKTFKIMIPNYPGIMLEIGKSIEKLGASDIAYDEISNNITFTADYPTYKRIFELTNDIKNNMALITMRIVMINVVFSEEQNYGIDWSQLVAGWNGQKQSTFGIPALSNSTTSTTTTTTSAVTTAIQEGAGAVFSSTGANIYIQGAKFTLSAFMSFINNYGKSSILQNVFVQTLSGKAGKLTALTETPYVSNVGVSALSNNSVVTQAAATTDKAKSGVELTLTPSYTKDEGTITVSLTAGLFGVTRFITLQAGTLGSFNQPITTKKTVDAVIRMSPSQTAIIGGLTFDKKGGSTTGLPGDTYLTNSVQTVSEKEELIIILKPQIFEFVAI